MSEGTRSLNKLTVVNSDILTGESTLPKEDQNPRAGKAKSDVYQIQSSLSTGPADQTCS